MQITTGVILCILSILQIIISSLVLNADSSLKIISLASLFIIISIAITLFIIAGTKMDSYKQILQENEYSPKLKEVNELVRKVAAIYWPLVVTIYFIWSFGKMAWDISWIIWPIAGVLFAVINGICNIVSPIKNHN